MILKLLYTCVQTYKYKQQLCHYILGKNRCAKKITDLSIDRLVKEGIKGLILDFDGVLAPNNYLQPIPEVVTWLEACSCVFQHNIFILSNKPTIERKEYFAKNFPQIKFIIALRKKPYPDSILEILKETKLAANELLIVDDRLCTGILAAIISNIQGCFITQPLIDLRNNFIYEKIFSLLRKIEMILVKII